MKGFWARRRVLGLVAVMMLSGCAVSGLSLVQDDRVEIVEPTTNATVRLPFEVRWTVTDFDGLFVVFFDRSPMRPNDPLLSVVPEGDPCRAEPRCPAAGWLANRNIYVTEHTRLVVETLPDLRDTPRSKDRHEVTIVLMDKTNRRRAGESASTREFIVDRER